GLDEALIRVNSTYRGRRQERKSHRGSCYTGLAFSAPARTLRTSWPSPTKGHPARCNRRGFRPEQSVRASHGANGFRVRRTRACHDPGTDWYRVEREAGAWRTHQRTRPLGLDFSSGARLVPNAREQKIIAFVRQLRAAG